MHPYITEQLANERVKSFHQEAAAERRARRALQLLRRRSSSQGRPVHRPVRTPSRPAAA